MNAPGLVAARSPAFGVVAPFFLAAPLGLVAAGLLLLTADDSVLAGINVPRTVAITHAAVIGWLTTAIMAATYQLGSAVLGGRLLSERLARVQFVVHAGAVALFVWSLLGWHVTWMSAAGVCVVISFILFLVNAVPAVVTARSRELPRAYFAVALGFLVVTAAFGITWVGTLEHLWFPVTLGRLGGHAHLGLIGWLAIVIMGSSYQLVPMFNIVKRRQQRFGRIALIVTATAALVAGIGLMFDPPRAVRVAFAVALAAGPALWTVDVVQLLRARFRRKMDIQGHATFVSLGFLVAALVLGIAVAWGSPVLGREDAARWQLAYGITAIGGWAGLTLLGNSYKIVPFLVWYHRYRERAGFGPVPMIADLYNDRLAHAVLVLHGAAVAVAASGALAGNLSVLRTGGALLALSGATHAATLAHTVFAPHAARSAPLAPAQEATS